MSLLEQSVDSTGTMSQVDLNSQDISNIIDELNRLQSTQGVNRSVNGTDYYYDQNGVNYMQIGLFTDGTNGVLIAKSGVNVDEILS